jgi:hypothetical protein
MSNEPRITDIFYKLQWIPKFTDNQGITDTDMCIVSIIVHLCVHSFCRCYTRFGAYSKCIHIEMIAKITCKYFQRGKKTAHMETNVRARVFNARMLARNQHPEGPATGELDQGFPCFPWSQTKFWVGTQIPRCTACFTCIRPNGNIRNFALMSD